MIERTFKAVDRNGALCDFELKTPGMSEENEGERQYRIAFSKALVEGIFPKEKLREVMNEHGMWTEDDNKALREVVGKIALLQIDLRNAEATGDEEKCRELAVEISEFRRRMLEIFMVQQSVYINSAEGVAEIIKTESIMASCIVVKNTGKRYWKDYSEFVHERDLNTKSTVYAKAVEIQTALLDEVRKGLFADYPEARYLKSIPDRLVDREIEEEVTRKLHNRIKKATKKKVTRRKKSGKRVATNSSQSK